MSKKISWTAVVPARAGSKGLPGKNTKKLAGVELYLHSVNTARDAGAEKIIVTTDIKEIILREGGGFLVHNRADYLAEDNAPMSSVLLNLIEEMDINGTIALLQPTSPMRKKESIVNAISIYSKGNFDLVMSVCETDRSILKNGFLNEEGLFLSVNRKEYCFQNRQSLPPVYRPNGAIYIFDANWFLKNGGFESERIGALVMSEEESADIDDLDDFLRCQKELEISG